MQDTVSDNHENTIPSLWQYWRKPSAILSLIAIAVMTVASIAMDYFSLSMNKNLGDALQAMNQPLFYHSLYQMFCFLMAWSVIRLCLDAWILYCRNTWRDHVVKPLQNALIVKRLFIWLEQKKSTVIKRWPELAVSQGQVMTDDTYNATDILTYYAQNASFIGSFLMYAWKLYRISPTLLLWSWSVPHGLFWLASGVGVLVAIVSKWLIGPVLRAAADRLRIEDAWRSNINHLVDHIASAMNTTGIAKLYDRLLGQRFKEAIKVGYRVVVSGAIFDVAQDMIGYVFWLLPYLLVAPLMFTGMMGLGDFFMIGRIFQEVLVGMQSLFSSAKRYAATYASINRLDQMREALSWSQGAMDIANKNCTKASSSVTPQDQVFNVQVQAGRAQPEITFTKDQLDGKMVYLCGSNGVGKTQLLKAIVGQERIAMKRIMPKGLQYVSLSQEAWKPDSVRVRADGKPLTVEDYLQLNAQGQHEKRALDEAYHDLIALGFTESNIATLPFNDLSGGQRQKVALARALLLCDRNTVLIADEPFAAVDGDSCDAAKRLLQRHLDEHRLFGMLLVDHNHTFDPLSDLLVQKSPGQ